MHAQNNALNFDCQRYIIRIQVSAFSQLKECCVRVQNKMFLKRGGTQTSTHSRFNILRTGLRVPVESIIISWTLHCSWMYRLE